MAVRFVCRFVPCLLLVLLGCVENKMPASPADETAVDETAVDETAVDETAVDETAVDDDNSAEVTERLGMEFVLIDVSAGDPLERYSLTNNFHMMTTEITQKQFTSVHSYYDVTSDGSELCYGVGDNYPAYNASWSEFAALANTLSSQENLLNCYTCTGTGRDSECIEHPDFSGSEVYNCPGYRFPTQAEWEYAARAGTTENFWTGDGVLLGGDSSSSGCDPEQQILDGSTNPLLGEYAWFCGNNDGDCGDPEFGSQEVGQKRPNGFGLYDMHGNLTEWTVDTFSESYSASGVNPIDLTGRHRSGCGGYWGNHSSNMYVTSRYFAVDTPEFRLGARFVKNAP